jgi:hypothetical protein
MKRLSPRALRLALNHESTFANPKRQLEPQNLQNGQQLIKAQRRLSLLEGVDKYRTAPGQLAQLDLR